MSFRFLLSCKEVTFYNYCKWYVFLSIFISDSAERKEYAGIKNTDGPKIGVFTMCNNYASTHKQQHLIEIIIHMQQTLQTHR